MIHLPAMIVTASLLCLALWGLHHLSYHVVKNRIVNEKRWDLNICCGFTDAGGINVDIVCHDQSIPNFVRVDDIYHLPFKDGQFEETLCSHTIEHVDDPVGFYRELRRVSRNVTLIVPPLWDPVGFINFREHKWIYLTWKKRHEELPPLVRHPFSELVQSLTGQKIKA